jgi:hypothetical protein
MPSTDTFKDTYPDTPQGWAKRWSDEFAACKPVMDKFHKSGDKILKIFLGEQGVKDDRVVDETLNLFYANTTTVESLVFGNMPKAEVDRTFADAADEKARIAAEMLERMLNQDIQDPGKNMCEVFKQAMQDRLLPGLGCARVRYDFQEDVRTIPNTGAPAITHPTTGVELVPAVPAQTETFIANEWVDIIYTHWKDFKWSPARTHGEIRWKAFRSYMSKEELQKRFGKKEEAEGDEEEVPTDEDQDDTEASAAQKDDATPDLNIDEIPLNSKGPFGKQTDKAPDTKQIIPQAEVWEIWCLESREVFWFVENFDQILDRKEDPLGLDQFWPDAPPMIANATTSKYQPKADYAIAQDLYAAVDVLQRRISRLTDACKLVGVYDKSNDEIKRVFQEGVENQLIPVDNWAMFAEKGGLEGSINWLPIKDVVATIAQLQQQQDKKVQQLYELTGMADIIRGASQQQYTSATETKEVVKYASVRMQKLQNEFATWVSNLQNLKAEIICKHFQPQSIIKQSNIMMTVDGPQAGPAIAFMKRDDSIQFRVRVQPETMAMADYAQMKQDRTEFLEAISHYMQSASPLMQADKNATPIILQLLKWGLAGFKGAQEIQGVLDQAIKAAKIQAQQPPPPPPPDPKIQAIQAESQAKIQILQAQAAADAKNEQAKQAMELERAASDHQAYLAKNQQQMQLEEQKFQNQMELLKAELVVNLAKLGAQQKTDVSNTAVDMIQHAEKTKMDAAADTHKAILGAASEEHSADVQQGVTEHAAKTQKEVTSHAAKVQVQSGNQGNGADK